MSYCVSGFSIWENSGTKEIKDKRNCKILSRPIWQRKETWILGIKIKVVLFAGGALCRWHMQNGEELLIATWEKHIQT